MGMEDPGIQGRRSGQSLEGDGQPGRWGGLGGAGNLSALAQPCGSRQSLIFLLYPDWHRNSRAANSAPACVINTSRSDAAGPERPGDRHGEAWPLLPREGKNKRLYGNDIINLSVYTNI